MTDTAELIARLRDAEVGYRPHVVGKYLAEAADAIASLVRERDEARKVLRDHHKWHAESGVLGIPDGDGGWIEMDNGAEYADSRLCQRTEAAISGMSPEVVVPPRGGWSMGSNHWENWQLAYRQKRAAEARATAAEANAARMLEALNATVGMCEQYAQFIRRVPAVDIERHPYLPELEQVIEVARNALGGKDERTDSHEPLR